MQIPLEEPIETNEAMKSSFDLLDLDEKEIDPFAQLVRRVEILETGAEIQVRQAPSKCDIHLLMR